MEITLDSTKGLEVGNVINLGGTKRKFRIEAVFGNTVTVSEVETSVLVKIIEWIKGK